MRTRAGALRAELGQRGEVVLGAELGEGTRGHLGRERLAVVVVVVLDLRDALAHHGVEEEAGRRVLVARLMAQRHAEGPVHGLEVVAVDLEDVPAVGAPLRGQLHGHDVVGLAADLEPVHVDEGDEVVEPELRGEASGLADLALLLLAVAHTDEGARASAVQAVGEGEAGARGEALAEVAGVPLDARDDLLDVPPEDAARAPEADVGLFDVEVPHLRERAVYAG